MVSGSFSLLCSRFFSPFLHSTGSLSVSREYLALRDGPRRFIQDFSCPALLRILLSLSLVSPTGLSPSLTGLSRPFGYLLLCHMQSFYPDSAETEPVWALPLSLAATHRITCCFLFLRLLRCFSSPGSLMQRHLWLPVPQNRPAFRFHPLVLRTELLKYPAPTTDRDRTVSRRSEPSSRTTLIGEQPNPWDRIQPQDVMSRHRCV